MLKQTPLLKLVRLPNKRAIRRLRLYFAGPARDVSNAFTPNRELL
ncbi:MAG: hypothetical protein RIQ93_2209 [Verrucomicrobiota bacterium]|jgi:hypothetical protein